MARVEQNGGGAGFVFFKISRWPLSTSPVRVLRACCLLFAHAHGLVPALAMGTKRHT